MTSDYQIRQLIEEVIFRIEWEVLGEKEKHRINDVIGGQKCEN